MAKSFVSGLDQLGERMRTLEPKRALGACVSATGTAARMVRDAAKDNVRRSPSIETGSLLEAVIVKKVRKSQTSLTSEHLVTVRGRGKPANKKGQKIAEFKGAIIGALAEYKNAGSLWDFRVDTDSVNNPTTIAAGELHARVLIQASPYAEFVIIDVVKTPISQSIAA